MSGPTIVQTVEVNGTSGSITVGTAGNAVVCILAGQALWTSTVTGISYDGNSSDFTVNDSYKIVSDGADGKHYNTGLFSLYGATAAAHTVAVTYTNPGTPRMFLCEVSGLGAADVITAGVHSSGTGTAVTSGSATTTAENDLLLNAITALTASLTVSSPAFSDGTTATTQATNGSSITVALISGDQAAAGAVDGTATLSAAAYWMAYLVSYKAGANAPVINSVNNGAAIPEGSTAVPLGGANFSAGMTLAATQPNGVSVDQSSVAIQSNSAATLTVTTQPTGTLTTGIYNVALTPDSSSGSGAVAAVTVSGGVATVSGPRFSTGVAGTYTGVALTGGSGSGAVATITVTGTSISGVAITTAGTDYLAGDVLNIAAGTYGSGSTATTVTVATLSSVVVSGAAILYGGGSYAVNDTLFIPQAAIIGATSNGVVTVATISSTIAATFTNVMEPATGDQLAYTDSTFITNLVATVSGISSTPCAVTLTPPTAGILFQTLGTLNPIAPNRITAEPDLVPGDQLEFAGNSAGTTAPAAGTVPHSDGSFEASADFYVRAYIQADAAWTPRTLITVSPAQPGQGFFGEGGV